jgi:hypothetical protein
MQIVSQETIVQNDRTQTEKDVLKHEKAIRDSPIYIMNADSTMLNFLQVFFQICALPSVILNLLIIAFGFEESLQTAWIAAQCMEGVFLMDIILHFFTSFRDDESNETITSLKKIAKEYIFNGSFLSDLICFIPW